MMKRLLLLLIRFYRRFISPMHAPCCPFTPTCSTYAMQAVERHGALYGGYLAIRRLLRCQPFIREALRPRAPETKPKIEKTDKKSFIPRGRPFAQADRLRTILDARRTFRP